jgi:hypothetical protein
MTLTQFLKSQVGFIQNEKTFNILSNIFFSYNFFSNI